MSRSLSYLRRGLLGITFVGSLGFGATHAFASRDQAAGYGSCELTGRPYFISPGGCPECLPNELGYCSGYSTDCVCLTRLDTE